MATRFRRLDLVSVELLPRIAAFERSVRPSVRVRRGGHVYGHGHDKIIPPPKGPTDVIASESVEVRRLQHSQLVNRGEETPRSFGEQRYLCCG